MTPDAQDDNEKKKESVRHFDPKRLLPYGGFGDPELKEPFWHLPEGFDTDTFEIAKAQHRISQRIRKHAKELNIPDVELEEKLGYRRHSLIRKLNGNELMTIKDFLRIARAFGTPIISSLLETGSEIVTLADNPPEYEETDRKKFTDEEIQLHKALHDAARRLNDASNQLNKLIESDSSKNSHKDTALALAHLADVVTSIGASLSRKPITDR